MEDSSAEENGKLVETKIEEEQLDEIGDDSIKKEGEIRVCDEEETDIVCEEKLIEEEIEEKVIENPRKRGKKDKVEEITLKDENLGDEINEKDGEIEEKSEKEIPKKKGKKSVAVDREVTNKEGEEVSKKNDEDLGKRRSSRGVVRKNYNDDFALGSNFEDEENERKTKRRKGGGGGGRKRKNVGETGTSNNKGKKKVEEEGSDVEETITIKKKRNAGGDFKGRKGADRRDFTPVFDENGIKIDSVMCHQCQRNDKGRVIRCTKCKTKRYCIPCTKWYPQMTEDQIAEACPVCLHNCNCKSCLRMEGPIYSKMEDDFAVSHEKKIEYSKNLLKSLLPFLKQIDQEQMTEKAIEADIQGVSVSELKIPKGDCGTDERVFCNYCETSIVDFHRSCPSCTYDLCLSCCREIRAGRLQFSEKIVMESPKKVPNYHRECHGLPPKDAQSQSKSRVPGRSSKSQASSEKLDSPTGAGKTSEVHDKTEAKPVWTADEKGRIQCPPVAYQGCGGPNLELKSFLSDYAVSDLVNKVEKIVTEALHVTPSSLFSDEVSECNLRKCASRESCHDNYLYSADARDIEQGHLDHFQRRWGLGEPVIVRSVLETTPGLSWAPMVMWCAVRQIKNTNFDTVLDLEAVDCLD